ncbi:MAG TPA: cellulase family glycosylhydrolase [Armatimonadota bacterium]|nr:cellulase family glycosylhydrolase [Armatimonadota bacterium]
MPRAVALLSGALVICGSAATVAQDEPDASPWERVRQRYEQLRTELSKSRRPYGVWLRDANELWVYDNRTELGIGMHDTSDAQLDLLPPLGIRLVRKTLYWNRMENTTQHGQYDAAYLAEWDSLAKRAEKRGIDLLVVVHGNAPGTGWANREASYERFARFMADMATRYPTIRLWELWNEMDSGFTDLFGAGVEPAVPMLERGRHYAEMLKVAYRAIKQANPDAWVLTGGMTDWQEFPRGIYEGGGRDAFDFMNVHTYGVPVVWSLVTRGAELRQVMAEFGDAERPLWNTEFGIDAGALVAAWGLPHERGEDDGPAFDRLQLEQWKECIEAGFETGLYAKLLPYQLLAGNEGQNDRLKTQAYAEEYLPAGHTIDDYGFGIVRSDGKTPRPTYEWLAAKRWNDPAAEAPHVTVDVEVSPAPEGDPVDYGFERRADGAMVIRDVRLDRLFPTRIRLE